jgi:hypothetical protein
MASSFRRTAIPVSTARRWLLGISSDDNVRPDDLFPEGKFVFCNLIKEIKPKGSGGEENFVVPRNRDATPVLKESGVEQ